MLIGAGWRLEANYGSWVSNGPSSHTSPTGKAKKWKTAWGTFREPTAQLGRTHIIHTRTHAVNHLSRKKRQMSDMDRRCLEENKLSGEAGGLPGGGRRERDLANA